VRDADRHLDETAFVLRPHFAQTAGDRGHQVGEQRPQRHRAATQTLETFDRLGIFLSQQQTQQRGLVLDGDARSFP
jgi:hypothetical protein